VFQRLDFASAFQTVDAAVRLVLATRPGKKILLTTSPVPLGRTFTDTDVIMANMYSKSVLRAVAEEITVKYPAVDYFPSYETVMLTDRRLAWTDDLRHVRDDLVGRIVERVSGAYFPASRETGPRAAYAEARMLLSAGQSAQALALLEPLRGELAGDVQFQLDLGTACMRAHRWPEAVAAFEAAIALDPGASRAHLLLARARWSRGDVDGARQAAQQALSLDARDAKARAFLDQVDRHLARAARHPTLYGRVPAAAGKLRSGIRSRLPDDSPLLAIARRLRKWRSGGSGRSNEAAR
jgi:tetratricopeptide (TPR) repeat protein